MAAGILPKPGTQYGPCEPESECTHVDCAATRAMAARPCNICGQTIGYEKRFYREPYPDGICHALCLEDKIDAEREKAVSA